MTTNTRRPLFERLKQRLEEEITHSNDELTLKTVKVPDDPPEIDAWTLAALRTQAARTSGGLKLIEMGSKALRQMLFLTKCCCNLT